ncbi:MAG: hypothetical protein J0H32_00845 [Rhizobiales bacterium]|nr:hypothetical protein [Hyphomicrobiales bacterium]MBN8983024.1 hypothetical protein [Hyphomicrobiales bacterium]MBN9001888.1 hypothetical protein [Hyphomicrobiales bacterium]
MTVTTIEQLPERVNADAPLVRRGRFLATRFLLEVGDTQWLIGVQDGKIVSVERGPFVMPSWSFALRASDSEWQTFWSANPPPGHHDLMALIKRRALKAEGDLKIFVAYLRYFKDVLAKLRAQEVAS